MHAIGRTAFVVTRHPSEAAESSQLQLQWSGECCIDSVSERKPELSQLLAAKADVWLDLAAVSRIDTAGLQLLAAFVLELGSRGHLVHWRAVSAAVRDAARTSGLEALLGLRSQGEH
ncbi:MAG TPA: STAS domain-containing protein [Polyangiales bacterium]|nr:STAS domain-containing protein [Polyangiales bacterium]